MRPDSPTSVSAVIPAFNAGRWIGGAIESVLRQTRPPEEVVVVDDGSTDDTHAVVASFGSAVRYVRQSNAGVSAARNLGVAKSSGDMIAFLDADDEWLPRKLEVQVARLGSEPDALAAFMSMVRVDVASGRKTTLSYVLPNDLVAQLVLHSCVVGAPSSVLIRRTALDAVGGFDPDLSQCADLDMWIRLAAAGPVIVVEEPHVLYRWHEGNMSRSASLLEADTLRVLGKFFGNPKNDLRFGAIKRRAYANHYLTFSGSYLHAREWRECLRCLARAISLHPPHLLRALGTPLRAGRRLVGRLGSYPEGSLHV